MRRFHVGRYSLVLALMLALWAVAVQAQEFRYRYVSLDEALPPGSCSLIPR